MTGKQFLMNFGIYPMMKTCNFTEEQRKVTTKSERLWQVGKLAEGKKVYNTTFHAMTITFEYVSNFI